MMASWKPSPRTSGRFLTPRIVDETGSTNADLVDRARQGAPSGEVLIARHQTAGKGRQGRSWFDRPDTGLLMSCSIDIDPALGPLVPLVVGAAVSGAIDDLAGEPTTALKWPNDVLVPGRDERKLAGILAEAVSQRGTESADQPMRIVVGMGLNLDLGFDTGEVPAEIEASAVDLRSLLGRSIDRPRLVDSLLDAFATNLDLLESSPDRALEVYRRRCLTIGRSVRFQTGSDLLEGTVLGIADDGALVLETPDGVHHHLTAGDAHHVR